MDYLDLWLGAAGKKRREIKEKMSNLIEKY